MTINTICETCIDAVRGAGYNESTVFNYEGVVRRFKQFCQGNDVTEYSCEIGKLYANDVISKKAGKFSLQRYHSQGRFIRLLDSYFLTGIFDFSTLKRSRITPDNPIHKITYKNYQKYLHSIYDNKNTVYFYEYGMYCLLQFLNRIGTDNINDLQPFVIMQYIKETKQTRQRETLCELRGIFRYLNRNDLLNSIAGIHASTKQSVSGKAKQVTSYACHLPQMLGMLWRNISQKNDQSLTINIFSYDYLHHLPRSWIMHHVMLL